MDPIEVLEVLLYTEDGEEYRIRPRHSPNCMKHKSKTCSAFTCDGCRFDLACNELLSLTRVELDAPPLSEEAKHYADN